MIPEHIVQKSENPQYEQSRYSKCTVLGNSVFGYEAARRIQQVAHSMSILKDHLITIYFHSPAERLLRLPLINVRYSVRGRGELKS